MKNIFKKYFQGEKLTLTIPEYRKLYEHLRANYEDEKFTTEKNIESYTYEVKRIK